jgi:transcriptional regulator with XRE-family HTH domain
LQLAHRSCNGWKGNTVQAQFLPLNGVDSLTTARRAASLTIRQVADLMGVSTTAVQAWESGRSLPAPHNRPYLAEVLGITRLALELALSNTTVIAQPVPERTK